MMSFWLPGEDGEDDDPLYEQFTKGVIVLVVGIWALVALYVVMGGSQ